MNAARGGLLAAFAALSVAPARAQPVNWEAPEIKIERLNRARFPAVPIDEVASGGFPEFARLQRDLQGKGGVRALDVATILVRIKGQWWVSAEASAKEEAAELGANFILLESSFGHDLYPDSRRVYRAVRLETYAGLPAFTVPRSGVESPPAQPPAPPGAPSPWTPTFKVPLKTQGDLVWLWQDHAFVRSHRLGLDTSALTAQAWQDLERMVKTRFPAQEHKRLLERFKARSKIVVDLRRRTVWSAP